MKKVICVVSFVDGQGKKYSDTLKRWMSYPGSCSYGQSYEVDEDGDTFIVGRKKDMIITGGENVYPQEVEQCLINYSGIREAAVVGMADEKWGEIVVAFVVAADGDLNNDAVIAHCRATLASYKIPKKIVVLDELPKTHVGKIDSGYLCEMLI